MGKHKHKKTTYNLPLIGMAMIKANLIGYALTAIFIIFASIVLTYTNLGISFEKTMVMIGCMVSAYLVGYDMAKVGQNQGYKWGSLGGASYLLIFIILSIVTQGNSGLDVGYLFILSLLILLSSTVAGMISVNTSK